MEESPVWEPETWGSSRGWLAPWKAQAGGEQGEFLRLAEVPGEIGKGDLVTPGSRRQEGEGF